MNDTAPIDSTAWTTRPCSWATAAQISQQLGIPQVAAMVLAGRGVGDVTAAREFLECNAPLPDPFLFSDMAKAARVLGSAIDEGRKVVVHGDYDADGITATALMVSGLQRLGADVDSYLPSRFKEGYGLSVTAVEAIADQGADVLVTVDCGVNYPDEVALAQRRGLEVVVVDHHEPGPVVPECVVIHHSRGEYPDGELCGVGLALKVLHAVYVERQGADRHSLPKELMTYLDLVAIGTVADLSALRGENRYYVREGLRLLNLGQRVGLRALAEVSNCAGAVDSGSIAFRLAPRLNAAGRLADPGRPLNLLLTRDEGEADKLAAELHELNGERQDVERSMFEAARHQVESLPSLPTVLVLADEGWHEGVVGIVASRMVELYQRPTIMLGLRDGVAKGSGRSIPAYDLLSGIDACGHLLTVYGGHAQAAGLTMAAEQVDAFREELERHASTTLGPQDLVPRYRADAVITSDELNPETVRALRMFEPFGSGNPRPHFLVVDSALHNVEKTRNGQHLRCRVKVGGVSVQAIGFGMGDKAAELAGEGSYVIGARLNADEWQGSMRTQLVLERISSLRATDARLPPPDFDQGCGAQPIEGDADPCTNDTTAQSSREAGPTLSGRGWPGSVRDLRDRPGRVTALAQVLATGESVVVVTASAARSLQELRKRLPLEAIGEVEIMPLVSREEEEMSEGSLPKPRVIVEWEAVVEVVDRLKGRSHVVALDPPYREAHVGAVREMADEGATVHLLYGDQERRETARLLRYLVHPRFGMICLYSARRSAEASNREEALQGARRLAWEQAGVCLPAKQLQRAAHILDALGLDTPMGGKAKLDARTNDAYRESETDYEECVRSCLTL